MNEGKTIFIDRDKHEVLDNNNNELFISSWLNTIKKEEGEGGRRVNYHDD